MLSDGAVKQSVSADGSFSPAVPIDFKQNPADGKIDTQRYRLSGGYDKRLGLGDWGTTLAFTQPQNRHRH